MFRGTLNCIAFSPSSSWFNFSCFLSSSPPVYFTMSESSQPDESPASSPMLTPPLPSQRRLRQASPELDDAERAQLELEEMMRSSPPPDETDPPDNTPGQLSDDIPLSPTDSHSLQSPGMSRVGSSTVNISRKNANFARRLAIKKKLHPYQREEIEQFVKVCQTYPGKHSCLNISGFRTRLSSAKLDSWSRPTRLKTSLTLSLLQPRRSLFRMLSW